MQVEEGKGGRGSLCLKEGVAGRGGTVCSRQINGLTLPAPWCVGGWAGLRRPKGRWGRSLHGALAALLGHSLSAILYASFSFLSSCASFSCSYKNLMVISHSGS